MPELHLLLITLWVVLGYTTTVWLLSLRMRDSGIMDVFWGPGFVLVCGLMWAMAPGASPRAEIVVSLFALWGFRLAWHIGRRNLGKPEDARYARWRAEAGQTWWWRSWFKVFLLQGVILWAVSIPLQTLISAPEPGGLTPCDWIGGLVILAGAVFEAVADAQLAAFKADPANRGRVMDRGLWRYSRHPNYFGESVIWVGVSIMVIGIPGGWVTLFGPVLMIWLIVRVSGVRMLDALLVETKPAYADYIRRTSAFIPWPPAESRGDS